MKRAILYGLLLWSSLLWAIPDFPVLSGRVVDQAGLLNPTDKAVLIEKLQQLETDTSAQLVLVTVNNLQGYAIADYALQLGRAWGIGQQEKNNGLILLVAKADKKMRIEVGYGLEGTIPDAYASYVIQSIMKPAFRQGKFSSGIVAGIEKLIAKINQDPSANMPERNGQQNEGDLILPVLIFLAMFNSFVGRKNTGWVRYLAPLVGAGLVWWLSQEIMLALFAGIFIFAASIMASGRNDGFNNRSGGGGFGNSSSGGFGGGGFGGGGGSFGGGGASGGW